MKRVRKDEILLPRTKPDYRDGLWGFGRTAVKHPCDPVFIPMDQFPTRAGEFRNTDRKRKTKLYDRYMALYLDEHLEASLKSYSSFLGVPMNHVIRVALAAFLFDPPPRRFVVGCQYRSTYDTRKGLEQKEDPSIEDTYNEWC